MLSPFHPMQLALGLIIWIAWFAVVYAGFAIVCEIAPPRVDQGPFTWVNAVLLLGTLVVSGLLFFWSKKCWRAACACAQQNNSPRRFIARLGAGVNLIGAIATLSLGVMTVPLPPCL